MEDGKSTTSHVEVAYEPDLSKPQTLGVDKFDGDVNLSGPGDLIYLIPTPSPDPRGVLQSH